MTGSWVLMASLVLAQAPGVERLTPFTTARLQAVSPVTDSIVWVSGTRGTWGLTTDGGTTWRTGVVPGADSLEFRDVHGFGARHALLLAAGPGDRSRIYQTANGGITWQLRFLNTEPDAFYDCFAFWAGGSGIAISDAVGGVLPVLRTTDGGRQWRLLESAPAAVKGEGAFAASGTCVATGGDSTAWIATGAGAAARILTTTDRGATWRAVTTPVVQGTPTSGHASIAFRSARDGLAAGGDLADTASLAPQRVVITADGGATWQVGGAVSFPGAIYGVAFVPGAAGSVVAVGPRGASWSPDGGRSWQPLDSLSHWSVAFASSTVGWMVGPEGRITKIRWP
jgi:photosystem II stability/assembly factor-like uncharacterized protein